MAWSNADDTTTYAQTAAVADVEVNKKTGKVTVKHVYQAVSAGLAVYPDGVANQIVGGATQIVSRLLAEQYRYGKTHVTSSDFVSYPILRFKDAPKVTPIVIQWNTLPTLGRGGTGGHGRRGRRRQRVLRRDRRAHAHRTVHARPRASHASRRGSRNSRPPIDKRHPTEKRARQRALSPTRPRASSRCAAGIHAVTQRDAKR